VRVNPGILTTLSSVAISSEEPMNTKMAAAVVRNNKIIAVGFNRMKSDPLQARFSKNSEAIFLHAEIHAIKNALRVLDVEDLRKCSIYICRVKKVKARSKEITWGLAKPCCGCMRAIREFGIQNIVYSLDEIGKYQVVSV
jgi:tRNA(Arg) A34 adenosine deaminase TadA